MRPASRGLALAAALLCSLAAVGVQADLVADSEWQAGADGRQHKLPAAVHGEGRSGSGGECTTV